MSDEVIINLEGDITVRQLQSDGEAVITYSEDIVVKARGDQAVSVELTHQGPQGPQGIAGPAGKDGINGTNGRDGVDGKDGIVTPELQTLHDQAVVAANDAALARNAAETAEDNALAHKNAAAASVTAANTAKTAAETAKALAEAAKTQAETARSNAELAQTGAIAAKDAAETAKIGADGAAAAANTSATNAAASETAAEDAAAAAAASVTAAQGHAAAAAQSVTDANTAKAGAETAADNAAASATAAQTAEANALAHSNTASTHADAADTAKTAAETANLNAQNAKAAAEAARTGAETARTDAQTALSGANAAKTAAESARDAAQTAENGAIAAIADAEAARDAAAASAAAAAASAEEAGQFDPTNYVVKGNNGSDFADPAQVRINIGAATAYEDVTQLEAEAGTGTIARNWSPQRVAQAIAALAAAKIHGHTVADITGLQALLDGKASLASPAFTGTPTVPTAAPGDRSLTIANTEYVRQALDEMIGAAPGTLDTLQEIADALGDDPNFAATVTQQLAGKADNGHTHVMADITDLAGALGLLAPLASPAFTGSPTAPTQLHSDNSTNIATTAHVKAAIANSGLSTEGHKHEIADVNGLQTALDGKAALAHTHVAADITDLQGLLDEKASLASPALTGAPTAPTQAVGNNSTRIATTAFVATAVANGVANKADLGHGHAIADIAGLQTALDGKFDKTGGTLTGQMVLSASAAELAPLNMPHGVAPTASVAGDLWSTTGGLYMNVNGTARTFYHSGNLAVVSQAEAEAGTATSSRLWTAQRVRQAIDKAAFATNGAIGSADDLDTYIAPGLWHQSANAGASGGTNYPVALAGMLTVTAHGSMVYQSYQAYSTGKVYTRCKYQTTWYGWQEHSLVGHGHVIADVSGLQAALDGKLGAAEQAADSAKLGGLTASQFLRNDTHLGNTIVRVQSGNGNGLRFWNGVPDYAIWMSAYGDTTYGGRLDTTSDYNIYFNIGGGTNRGFVFMNAKVPKVHIDGAGNIRAVGMIDCSRFYGTNADTAAAPSFTNAADLNTGIWFPAADQVGVTTGGVNRVTITSAGLTCTANITAYSDERLKTDIEQISGALEMVEQIRGVRFTMDGRRGLGVIAQELQKVAPELVQENDDEMKTLSVAYGNVVGILIEAVKELRQEVVELRKAA